MSTESGDVNPDLPKFKKFISEAEVEEKKRKRQEEWEKVRQPDQPKEAPPDEPEDPRCLFERLKEQKDMQQAEHDEKYQLKNQVRGLEEDEAHFLQVVSRRQEELVKEREEEENELLEEYHKSQANQVLVVSAEKPDHKPTSSSWVPRLGVDLKSKSTQSVLVAGAVKRKRSSNESTEHNGKILKGDDCELARGDARKGGADVTTADESAVDNSLGHSTAATVVAILPGIGSYTDSSESDSSSDSYIDTDLFRRVKVVSAEAAQSQHH